MKRKIRPQHLALVLCATRSLSRLFDSVSLALLRRADRTFSLGKKAEAIQHAPEIIDVYRASILPW